MGRTRKAELFPREGVILAEDNDALVDW